MNPSENKNDDRQTRSTKQPDHAAQMGSGSRDTQPSPPNPAVFSVPNAAAQKRREEDAKNAYSPPYATPALEQMAADEHQKADAEAAKAMKQQHEQNVEEVRKAREAGVQPVSQPLNQHQR